MFKIYDVKQTTPTTYLLNDKNNLPIKGGFYEQELQKTKSPDAYLIEVLKRKGKKLYVNWLGLNEKGWITTSDIA